jgi:multiple sugar transport system substrate-binding protein
MRGLRLITLAAIPVLVLGACSSTASTPSAATAQSAAPTAVTSSAPGTIRWFVGLGSGTQPNQIDAQKTMVADYNKSNKDGITLTLEIVPNANAYDVLKTEIAAGNAPDIIGPVGVKGRNGFEGLFLDLTNEVAKNNYDLKSFPDALVKFFQQGGDGQVGLPYDIFPGYIWYNKDAFAKAGLPPLPTTVGAQYQGATWDWNELDTIAKTMTLDSAGKAAGTAGFDATKIVKYGMDFQWADGRRIASCFGGGSFVATDGKTAQIPTVWADAFNWYYNAIWTDHIVPTGAAESSTLLAAGNSQSSGNVAMNAAWGWSISSIWDSKTNTAKMKSWDMGVMPSWKGTTTSPLDSDTFTITKASKNPDAAFKAMVAIMADPNLMSVYGGEPARTADQAAYFTKFDATLAPIFSGIKVTWSVLGEMVKYPAVPSHEANMPDFTGASNDYTAFLTKLQSKSGLNVGDELAKLKTTLQTDFDSVQSLT